MSSYTAKQLADILGKTERTIQRRAKLEKWPFDVRSIKGGAASMFAISSLPNDIQLAVNLYETERIKKTALALSPPTPPARIEPKTDLPLHKIEEAMHKAALLRQYTEAIERADWGKKTSAKNRFLLAYNAGAWPDMLQSIGPLTLPTLEKWRQEVKDAGGDILTLADTRGMWRVRATGIPEINQKILLSCVLHPNKPKVAEAIRMAEAIFEARGIPNGHHPVSYRRWLDGWIKTNYHAWMFNREGAKAWNDECAMYLERDISLINVGDILVADGHILNFEIINPFTGKPKRMVLILWMDMRSNFPLGWEILPTENTMGIASAFRRAVITLGKLPQVAYLDNGRAFGARFFSGQDCTPVTGLFERAGVRTIHAWPYHGQSKTIERFFGTFSELERWAPSYTGTSIENKPPRLMRGEKVHRLLHNKITGGSAVTIDQAHMAIAAWFDEYARRPQSGHLDGATPIEIFEAGRGPGVDIQSLDLMMLAEHIASPNRNGVYFLGRNYYHPDLANIRHKVLIRYDLQKRDSVLVYRADTGEFMCEATDLGKVHPAACILGTEADREKLTAMIELKKRQEKEASTYARRLLETEILPEHQRRMETIVIQSPAVSPAKQIEEKPLDHDQIQRDFEKNMADIQAWKEAHPEPDPEPEAYVCEVIHPAVEMRRKLEAMGEADRYEALLDMEVVGQMVPAEWKAFMTYFEMTPTFRRFAEHFETKRRLAAENRAKSTS